MALIEGQVLNQLYQIVQLLGLGVFGAEDQAWDLDLKIPCLVEQTILCGK